MPKLLHSKLSWSFLAWLAAALLVLGLAPARSAAAACRQHWVGSWAASPSDGSLSRLLVNQTLRMIVSPHLAGSTLRVHLSNRFGALPVTLGPVTVGVRSSGAALVAGSNAAVTFAGQTTVTIPAGQDAVSDPVTLSFAAFQDLAVSVYVPVIVVDPSEHLITRETSYLSPLLSGDHAADSSGSAFSETTTGANSTGWYFLDGVDVLAPGQVGAVAAFGDSITDGYQGMLSSTEQLGTIGTEGSYPDVLERRLIAARVPLSVLNAGISGNRLLTSSSSIVTAGPSGLSRFATDALGLAGVSDVIVLEGINDIAGAPATAASDLIAGYQQLVTQAHAAGVRIQLGTITPAGGAVVASYGGPTADAVREQVNQWIRTQHFSDGVIDFDAAVRDPANPSEINPAYDGGDHVHFNLAGYQAMAQAVSLALLARPQCTGVPPVTRVRISAHAAGANANARVTVTWSASDAGGPGIAYFTVQVKGTRANRASGAGRWRTLRGYATTTRRSVRFHGRAGQSYRFRARATDSSGTAGRWATTPRVTFKRH